MGLQTLQTSFIAGELSPNLFGRQDDQLLKLGAQELTNFVVRKTGTLIKRSGFQFVYDFGDQECRLEEFRFASDQTLVLVFTPNKLYFASKQGLVMNGDTPYSISTPYAKEDLWGLSFSQNADVVTITSAKHPPRELRRYGGTDWRFVDVKTKPDISAPSNFSGRATYPPFTPEDEEDKDPNAGTYDIIKVQYKITSVDKDGAESEPSSAITVNCNYYITGATVELSWSSVSGAEYYRVYRAVSGIYGFLGQTETTSMSDTGATPDTAVTPPTYKAPFKPQAGGRIVNISVIDGGSGYFDNGGTKGYIYLAGLPALYYTDSGSSGGPNSFGVKVILKSASGQTLGFVKIPYSAQYHRNNNHENSTYVQLGCSPSGDYIGKNGVIKVNVNSIHDHATATHVELIPYNSYFEGNSGSGNYRNARCYLGGWDLVISGSNNESSWSDPFKWSGCEDVIKKFAPRVGNGKWKVSQRNSSFYYQEARATWYNTVTAKLTDVMLSEDGGGFTVNNQITVPLTITDSQGSGATAEAYAYGGVIKSVSILNGGSNYYSPTITAHGVGSGARFTATLSDSSDAEYPSCSGQFDQRRVFAGSLKNPLKLWMTNAGSQNLMTVHTPLQDDDRIEIVALASDADIIKHIVAMDSLILFTGSSELRVFSQTGGGLGPRNIAVRAQSYVGANDVKPVVAKNTIVYVSARGAHPQGLNYTEASGLYMSQDLGVRCTHLFDGKNIVDMALSKTPEQLLFVVSTDGTLLTCNFLPEQNVNAWSRIRTDGEVTSVSAVAEGVEDRVYVAVKRMIDGEIHYYLECMAPSLYGSDADARCLDSYIEHTFDEPVDNITGLGHLNGKTVLVVGDGEVQTPKTVHEGKIKLDKKATHFVIGLPYESRIVTVPLEYTSPETIMAIRNIANCLKFRVSYGGNLKCAKYPMFKESDLYECKRNCSHEAEQNDKSVVLDARVGGNWGYQAQVLLVNDDHKPLEVACMLVDLGYLENGRMKR